MFVSNHVDARKSQSSLEERRVLLTAEPSLVSMCRCWCMYASVYRSFHIGSWDQTQDVRLRSQQFYPMVLGPGPSASKYSKHALYHQVLMPRALFREILFLCEYLKIIYFYAYDCFTYIYVAGRWCWIPWDWN